VSSPQTLRTDWLHRVVDQLQVAVGDALSAHPEITCGKLRACGERLPPPTCAVERLILRGVLFEYACRTSAVLHRSVHSRREAVCSFDDSRVVNECFVPSTSDPRAAFENWTGKFSVALRSAHPETKVQQVARHILENVQKPLNAERIASSVGLTTSGLRRAFHAEFGRSMREYQSGVRILMALDMVGHQKIIVVARELGYRSTKNFYRMFWKSIGLTPTAFRTLPESEKQLIVNDA
jgi:AraC-like DNA-binding protein